MSAKPTTPLYAKCLVALCFFVCCSLPTIAQVEPDTVKRKPVLPTGPPGEPTRQQPAPKPTVQPKPPVQQAPVVVQPQQDEDEEKPELIDRLYFGGSFGLQFGSYTNISLLPILGYRVTERLNVGVGAVYHYIKDGNLTLNNYGGRAFTQIEVIDIGDGALVAHAETEILSREYLIIYSNSTFEKQRKMITLPMAGLGYRQRITAKASFDLLLLYNFNDDLVNPYSNPVIRAGVNIPFRK